MLATNKRCCLNLIKAANICDICRHGATASQRLSALKCSPHPQIFITPKAHFNYFKDLFQETGDKNAKPYIEGVLRDLGDNRGIHSNGGKISIENPFKLFLLDEKLRIGESKLKREMVKLQRVLHPDKFYGKDKLSQDISEQLSALVNQAYETLKNPYKRAIQLLSASSGRNVVEIDETLERFQLEPEFLSKMLDLREQIEQTQNKHQLRKVAVAVESDLDHILGSLEGDFANKDFDSALEKLAKLKFLANCHVTLMERLEGYSIF